MPEGQVIGEAKDRDSLEMPAADEATGIRRRRISQSTDWQSSKTR